MKFISDGNELLFLEVHGDDWATIALLFFSYPLACLELPEHSLCPMCNRGVVGSSPSGVNTAALVLLAATARAGLIASDICHEGLHWLILRQYVHYWCRMRRMATCCRSGLVQERMSPRLHGGVAIFGELSVSPGKSYARSAFRRSAVG